MLSVLKCLRDVANWCKAKNYIGVAASSGGAVASGSIVVPVNAGDIVYLKGRSTVAGNIAGNNEATHLDITYIK